MAQVIIEYTDGTDETFPETSRPGGSYCTSSRVENGWFIIKDAWGKETYIPENKINKVTVTPSRY